MSMAAFIGKLGLDIVGWREGWAKAQGVAQAKTVEIGAAVKGHLAAMFGAAAIGAAIKNTMDYAARINDLSEELGISRDRVQELDFAARQNGTTFEIFEGTLTKLARARQAALDSPAGKETNWLTQFEISAAELKTLKLDDLLLRVADGFAAAENPQKLMVAAIGLLGKSSPKVFQALRNDLRQTMKDAHTFNQLMSDETITALEALGDQIDVLKGAFTSTFGDVLVTLLTEANRQLRQTLMMAVGAKAFLGAALHGENPFAAARAAKDAMMEKVKEDIRLDKAIANRVEKRKKDAEGIGLAFGATDSQNTTSGFKGTVTPWQQIGAFAFLNPMLTEQKVTNRILQKVADNTKPEKVMRAGSWLTDSSVWD